ncbi:BMP family ABC transporter substrate-binding protein [Halobacteriales archaeon QS_9_68_17]|nr:MAG: BMP family ABC transporter substrate-binding protein [Halobacteriales archaeon QS_9_68_17]
MEEERKAIRRRRVLGGIAGAGLGSIAGCATVEETVLGSSDGGDGHDDHADDRHAEETTAGTHVGMVYATAGLDDRSFNDTAHRGVQRSRLERDVSFDYREPDGTDEMEEFQRTFAESADPEYDLVCCIGFDQTGALQETAPRHTDQKFAIFDAVLDEPNVVSYVFQDHQGSFLVGSLAAQMTSVGFGAGRGSTRPDELTVGFVGGVEVPVVQKFEAGFAAGVEHADADVEVLTEYVGSFGDVDGGREAAEGMYDDGADIIYHAAGGTGLGVFQAAQERERFALGVDADQSRSNPRYSDVILASMTKRMDTAVYNAVGSVIDDAFEGGSVVPLGLEDDGLEVAYGSELGPAIPDELKSDVEETRAAIVDGDVEVPSEP